MPSDRAIIYQLEKVDQGGEVQDLFEDRIAFLADEWGYELVDDDGPHAGDIKLPDGRYAGLIMTAYIVDEEGNEVPLQDETVQTSGQGDQEDPPQPE